MAERSLRLKRSNRKRRRPKEVVAKLRQADEALAVAPSAQSVDDEVKARLRSPRS